MAAIQRARKINVQAILFTLAIVVAPFLALLYSMDLALGVLSLALGFTTWLTLHVANMSGPVYRSRLKTAAILNGVMMVATVTVLVLRLTT